MRAWWAVSLLLLGTAHRMDAFSAVPRVTMRHQQRLPVCALQLGGDGVLGAIRSRALKSERSQMARATSAMREEVAMRDYGCVFNGHVPPRARYQGGPVLLQKLHAKTDIRLRMIRAPGEHIGTAATGAVSPDRQFRSRLPIRVALFWLLVMRRDTARMAAAACQRILGVQRLFRLPGSSDESADKELQEAHAVTVIGLLKNVVLTLGKGVIGVTANSQALLADALHSLSDIVADLVAMATLRIARLPADKVGIMSIPLVQPYQA